MIQDYPKKLQQKVEAKSDKEKIESFLFGLPFITVLLLYPFFFGIYGKLILDNSFVQNSISMFILIFSFNLIDLLFVDWLIFCTVTLKFIVLPGTEKDKEYKNYYFHLQAFLKGTVFSALGAIMYGLIIEGVNILIM